MWGTYAYEKMPFGVINGGAISQNAMDISFKGIINKSIFIYLDDVTLYSRNINTHLNNLKHMFE